jgi:Xaa-Pro aminopeptidase
MSSTRRDRLRRDIPDLLDGILVTDLADIRYLTGFSGSNAALFLSMSGADGDIFCTDGRYVEQAAQQCPDLGVLVARDCVSAVVQQCVAQGAATISLDLKANVGTLSAIENEGLTARVQPSPVSHLRQVKDAVEVRSLEVACDITSRAVDILSSEIRQGDTEIKVARRLEQLFGELGAEDRSFATIVATGDNSAKPHHEPSDRRLEAGDLLVIDCGALVNGYHADMTRTFVVGEPAAWQVELHALVACAAEAGRDAARAGVALADLDAAARAIIENAGYGAHFGHGLGHGIGLDIHEAPMISPTAEGRLSAETTITVEPGVYLPGRGGVRIEDSLLVTADGHRSLTSSPRDLRIVG